MIAMIAVVAACSSKKNTAVNRRIQAFKANYNTYYNASLAYKDGRLAQEQGNKDNCTELIPLYMTGNKATAKLGTGNYSTAIEKCQKTIKLHSITQRPKWNGKKKTEKDKIWLSQKEYNPFLYKAWFLMGASQFSQGEYMEAASTYSYMQRLYFSKPDIVARARVLEAKCYAEMEWFYDAEDILRRAERDSFPNNLQNLKSQVVADLQVRQKLYEDAIPNLLKGIKAEKRNYQKARLYFLLGQLCQKVGRNQDAYKYLGKTISKNPPYELEFNARILRTEVMANGNTKRIVSKLKSMARDPKNADYLDQVYYAIGNAYLAAGDTLHAEWAYNDGVEKATRSGIEKGVLMVHLGQLYWDQEKFVKAQKMYSGALGMFDKERDDYKEINQRSKILEELLPFASAVELQDSLQELAQMDSVKRMEVIKKIIEDVKKKEKEEQKKAAEANNPTANRNQNQNNNRNQNMNQPGMNNQQGGTFYFYNPTTVTAGKTEFKRKWGERKLTDDWRRKNKTVLDDFNEPTDSVAGDSLTNDSIRLAELKADSLKAVQREGLSEKEKEELDKLEEYQKDPHRPEFYLKDIPFTEEQMEASNKALVEGLVGAAPIYKDEMENFALAERTYKRIMNDFPDYDKYDEIYYNLWQLYSRMGRTDEAEVYRQKMLSEYADNENSKKLADPEYLTKAIYGKAIEDSVYNEAYEAFKASDYQTVIRHDLKMAEDYPQGDNRPRFMFISAMSKLELGEREGFLANLKEIVEKYPKATISELAGLYVKGLKEGRLLASGKFEAGDIWDRKRSFADEADSLAADTAFVADKNCNWVFAIAYERDSISENQLLYEMARYNFSNFSVRNFDVSFQKGDGIDMFQTRTFLNYDEAYIYMHKLMNDKKMAAMLEGLKCFIISEDNLKKIQKGLSFSDYFDFYDDNFDRIGHLKIDENLLDEPTEFPEAKDEEEDEEEEYDYDDENFLF